MIVDDESDMQTAIDMPRTYHLSVETKVNSQ